MSLAALKKALVASGYDVEKKQLAGQGGSKEPGDKGDPASD